MRHNLLVTAVADVRNRYVNMDYIVLSTLKHGGAENLEQFIFSYDISCQWSRNLPKRIKAYPERLRIDLSRYNPLYKIPKFHLPAHGKSCQTHYSFNYTRGVGRTCGEGIEQGWAAQNPVSMSTKEMGPGARGETLDDHWGAWNFRKLTSLGTSSLSYSNFVLTNVTTGSYLLRLLARAVKYGGKSARNLEQASSSVPPDLLNEWLRMFEEYYDDPAGAENIFAEAEIGTSYPHSPSASALTFCVVTTLADIRLELAQQEMADATSGLAHEVTPSAFLTLGFDLEEQQYVKCTVAHALMLTTACRRVMKVKIAEDKAQSTMAKKVQLQKKANTLAHCIAAWRRIQTVYMPGIVPETSADGVDDDNDPEGADILDVVDSRLLLPSELPPQLRIGDAINRLVEKELRLRIVGSAKSPNRTAGPVSGFGQSAQRPDRTELW